MPVRVQKMTLGTPEKITPMRFKQPAEVEYIPQTHYAEEEILCRKTARGFRIELPLTKEEEIFGFGLQLKNVRHKANVRNLRVNADPVGANGESHAPSPFFVSTLGYGVFVDTARYATFSCGLIRRHLRAPHADNTIITTAQQLYEKSGVDEDCVMLIDIPAAEGADVYIFEGDTITDVVSQYNMFSGGGCSVPMWGLGVFYRCYARYTDEEAVDKARQLRQQGIPCTILGLEPGWQSSSYPCSFDWDPERFPNHARMMEELKKMDYHVNLWEHAFTASCSPIYEALQAHSGDFEVWRGIVPDFADPEAVRIFAEHHRKTLVEQGVDGFKLDECDGSDYTGGWSFPNCAEFPSGLDGEQMHCLFGVLYQRAVLKALDGRPTLGEVRSSGPLAAPYPFVLYSDLYAHRDFIRGLMSAGVSGLLWTPEVRGVQSREDLIRRLQTAVFAPQCLVNAWSIPESPWVQFHAEEEVRRLFNIRMALLPYLFTAFERYRCEGVAPVRPLVSDYTSDPETYAIDDEYLFGDSMLVAPIFAPDHGRRFYLPEGEWRNLFTGETYQAGWHEIETEDIPVFVKANSVIPVAAPVQTVTEETVFDVTVHTWGADGEGELADGKNRFVVRSDGSASGESPRYRLVGVERHR